jgi:hypothetical protein
MLIVLTKLYAAVYITNIILEIVKVSCWTIYSLLSCYLYIDIVTYLDSLDAVHCTSFPPAGGRTGSAVRRVRETIRPGNSL